jgi:hypothetical protein
MTDLRQPSAFPVTSPLKEPSFYKDDLNSYKIRRARQDRSTSYDPLEKSMNIAECEHLVRKGVVKQDKAVINFGFSLRNREKSDWDSNPSRHSSIDKFLPPLTRNAKEQLDKMKNVVIRPQIKVTDVR